MRQDPWGSKAGPAPQGVKAESERRQIKIQVHGKATQEVRPGRSRSKAKPGRSMDLFLLECFTIQVDLGVVSNSLRKCVIWVQVQIPGVGGPRGYTS